MNINYINVKSKHNMKKTLGGDRLGSGKKMEVELHGYERSTHDMSYIFRTTMSSGTLVPFLREVALPGDTFDIDLDCDVKTHPTIGPLFGSYKVQLDVFQCPIRLYQALLHNNALGIGLKMSNVKFPIMRLYAEDQAITDDTDIDNMQINPSSIMAYLGIRGIGIPFGADHTRDFNGIPFLAYWDIYKNYYSNKQEELGAVIHNEAPAIEETIDEVQTDAGTIGQAPDVTQQRWMTTVDDFIQIDWTGTEPNPNTILFNTNKGVLSLAEISLSNTSTGPTTKVYDYWFNKWGSLLIINWFYGQGSVQQPRVELFPLENIDTMRNAILSEAGATTPYIINTVNAGGGLTPYTYVLNPVPTTNDKQKSLLNSQEGLALKTYQSDLFNNWLQTEWFDGTGGINEITSIDTSGGSFTIDTLNLSKKVYDMLNRIAVSGGTYNDWLDAVYTHDRYVGAETPMYMGGLIKELVFQEVVSNAEAGDGTQPLGTLAGKGIMGKKHKGGKVTIKVDEPSYIMGIISLTPRIDYSQGNRWDMGLKTMDDLHKPALDEIGFQEAITEDMAWWSTTWVGGQWVQKSAGKQPAWIKYMTNVNQVLGNFAISSNEMFMTLNRRYEPDLDGPSVAIKDLTTYIDPSKFNHIFADTALDAQNFWTQIAVNMIARRKMSAKVMPNL